MEKIWIKFTSDWTQKGKNGTDDVSFKSGDVIQLDKETAESLIKLGFAEKTEEPKDEGAEEMFKSFGNRITETIEKGVASAFERAGQHLEKNVLPSFATPRDPELEGLRGFKSEDHFLKTVLAVGINSKNNTPFNGDMYGVGSDAYDLLTKAPSGQNISTDTEGGFMVPEVMANRIWDNMSTDEMGILGRTFRMTTGGNSMKLPRMFESSRDTGYGKRFGGVQVYWIEEAGEFTSSKMKTGNLNFELHKLGALVYLTEEIMDDSGFSFESLLRRTVPAALNFEITDSFIHGTGVGKPLGVLKADALIKIANNDKDDVPYGDNLPRHYVLSQMYWKNNYRNSAVWYVHPNVAELLEFMYFDDDTTNKRPVYLPANLTNTPFGTLYGRPLIPWDTMNDLGTEGDIGFFDWSHYGTLTKAGTNGGVKIASSIHVRFLYEETALRFSIRVDGRPLWTSPKEDYKGTTNRSPFVCRDAATASGELSGV